MDAIAARLWHMAGRADAALSFCETAFIGLALAFASLLLFANVVLRYIFLAPISWAEELSIYIVIWIVFIGGSVLIRRGEHIVVDLLPLALPAALRRWLQVLVLALAMVFFAALLYYSALHTLRVEGSGQRTPVMEAPMWLTYLAVPVGSLLMLLRSGQKLWHVLRNPPEEARREIAND